MKEFLNPLIGPNSVVCSPNFCKKFFIFFNFSEEIVLKYKNI